MTIDEVIENLKCDIEIDMYIHDIAPHIAEWLEELKHYQLGDCMNDCEHYENCANYIYSKGYNKAIDDLVDKIMEEFSYLPRFILEEIAEQLKR